MNPITVQHALTRVPISFGEHTIPDGIVITDQNLANHYDSELNSNFAIVLQPGEGSKRMIAYEQVLEQLADLRATRKSTLIAFGGGVIGDLVGFVAATYMRGIPYIQVPTSLLAQVDSSVGGKTGIDLNAGKNLVGAFNPPTQVLINSRYLQTLPLREFACGMAEIIKTGFILDAALSETLKTPLLDTSDPRLQAIIHQCVQIKADVVGEDEFETKGIRAKLNFGHTIGHAIEKVTRYSKYTHGEAISVGMVKETEVAIRLGLAQETLLKQLKKTLEEHHLPIACEELADSDMILSAMRSDKKSDKGELTFALVSRPGQSELVKDIPESVVRAVLEGHG